MSVFGFWFLVLGSWFLVFGFWFLVPRFGELAWPVPLCNTMPTIHHHEDLVAWQLAAELKKRVLGIIARPSMARHFKFCDQIRDSSRSGPANLAEGFWRYRPRENARFVRIALGSLGETLNHLHDAFTEKYIDENEYLDLRAIAERALKAATAWHDYLDNCPDKPPTERRQRRQRPNRLTKNQEPKT
jgi:four helix bundle protein